MNKKILSVTITEEIKLCDDRIYVSRNFSKGFEFNKCPGKLLDGHR